jgi:Ca-activated chloride channel homolog
MKLIRYSSIFLLVICFSLSVFAQDDDEIINVDSSIVILNASITDAKNNPVTDIKKNQFKVFEDEIEQEISVFEAQEKPFAAVILLDTSGSMEERVSLARSATISFLDGLRLEDNASIYNFDSKVSLVQDFSNSRDLAEKFYELKANGSTVLNDAIYEAAQSLGKRSEKRRAIIVLSDGADTSSKYSSDKALKAALAVNATIYTVDMSGLNSNGRDRMQNQGVLKNFAEKTGGVFIPAPGGLAMRNAFKNIVSELSIQYTLGYSPTSVKKDGKWRSIELRVSRPNLKIRTRKGYNAPKNK